MISSYAWLAGGELPSQRLRSYTFGLAAAVGFFFAWLTTLYVLPFILAVRKKLSLTDYVSVLLHTSSTPSLSIGALDMDTYGFQAVLSLLFGSTSSFQKSRTGLSSRSPRW
jgi:ABC-type sulfate transport system permease component